MLEERVAALEGGTAAVAVASGHAAQVNVFHSLLLPGDEFIAARRLYGGSINQFNQAFKSFGWTVKWADTEKPETFLEALTDKTKAIFIESIANPGGAVTDIAAIAAIARRARVPLIVDNTLATPYLLRPFEHGADIVVHSATKFLGGHGNSIGGVIVDGGSFNFSGDERYPLLSKPSDELRRPGDRRDVRQLRFRHRLPRARPARPRRALVAVQRLPDPDGHRDAAAAHAAPLRQRARRRPTPEAPPSRVRWVHYAGLESDPGHALAQRYSPKGAGAVFTFGVGSYEAGVALVKRLKLFSHLANVGDTRSLVIHPASTTHRQLADEQKLLRRCRPPTWCACRSGWKMSPISSRIWIRRWGEWGRRVRRASLTPETRLRSMSAMTKLLEKSRSQTARALTRHEYS